jgi:hypothetical protein
MRGSSYRPIYLLLGYLRTDFQLRCLHSKNINTTEALLDAGKSNDLE